MISRRVIAPSLWSASTGAIRADNLTDWFRENSDPPALLHESKKIAHQPTIALFSSENACHGERREAIPRVCRCERSTAIP
ncbi:MAG: hypothetical protein NZT92_23990, partial [Abditibacteriales bacterium]|nr:hypothetical protein [Abditibacteriales bacterium]